MGVGPLAGNMGAERRLVLLPATKRVTCGTRRSRSMTRFFAAWVTHEVVGCAVAPRIRIRRLACSIAANTYSLAPDSVTVSEESHASGASAAECRKSAYVVEASSGAELMPDSRKISQAVDAATFTPKMSGSPCRRRYPRLGLF
jgi:hypothetical protein